MSNSKMAAAVHGVLRERQWAMRPWRDANFFVPLLFKQREILSVYSQRNR